MIPRIDLVEATRITAEAAEKSGALTVVLYRRLLRLAMALAPNLMAELDAANKTASPSGRDRDA